MFILVLALGALGAAKFPDDAASDREWKLSRTGQSTPATPVWTDFFAVCEALNSSGHDDERGCSEKSFLATAEVVGRDAARARCRSTCAPYSTGHWCQNLGARCRWPQLNTIVEAGTGALLRPFHVSRGAASPLERCVRAIDEAGPLHAVFVGDSQTKMMMFEWSRWLDAGDREPIWAMTGDAVMAAIEREHGWGLSTHLASVVGMYEPKFSEFFNNTIDKFEALGRHAASLGGAGNHTRLVVVLGWGVWDAIFSSEKDVFGTFFAGQERYLDAIFQAVATCDGCWGNVHVFLRNSWTSKNPTVGLARHTDLLQAINIRNPAVVARYQGLYPTWKFREVDVWGLSWPRRDEMPYDGDGLHWACISKGKTISTCRNQIGNKRSPDEVAIASLQVITNQLCDDFGDGLPRQPVVKPQDSKTHANNNRTDQGSTLLIVGLCVAAAVLVLVLAVVIRKLRVRAAEETSMPQLDAEVEA